MCAPSSVFDCAFVRSIVSVFTSLPWPAFHHLCTTLAMRKIRIHLFQTAATPISFPSPIRLHTSHHAYGDSLASLAATLLRRLPPSCRLPTRAPPKPALQQYPYSPPPWIPGQFPAAIDQLGCGAQRLWRAARRRRPVLCPRLG
jgi:hypothetical protein